MQCFAHHCLKYSERTAECRGRDEKRVLEVVRKRGYQPNYIARGLRIQKTRMIGIIVEDLVQFSTAGVVDGIMECCEKWVTAP